MSFANEANILGNSIVVAFSDKAIKLMDLISLNTDCFVKQLNGFDFRDYCSKYNTSFLQSVSKPKDYNQIVKLAKRSIHKAHKQLNIKRFFARLKNKVFKKHE